MKFKLNPSETAAENLWRACTIATQVILKKKPIYRALDQETLRELRENIELRTYENFLYHKVMLHKYTKVAANGKPLDFFDNVLSACWSVSSHQVDLLCKEMNRRSATTKQSKLGENDFDFVSNASAMPKYLATFNRSNERVRKRNPLEEEYAYYLDDCAEFGITPITIDEWMERNQ